MLPDSNMVITFTETQNNAIKEYLKLNPNLILVTAQNVDREMKIDNYNYFKNGDMQYQYACWGDLNNDGYLDLLVVFKSQKKVNAWGWVTYDLVLIKGSKNGTYQSVKLHSFNGGCLSGILFHKKDHFIEFYCSGVATGTIKWKNGRFIIKKMIGD
jgi:hypothetical protein